MNKANNKLMEIQTYSRADDALVTIRHLDQRWLEEKIYEIERNWERVRDWARLCAVDYDNLVQERERRADALLADAPVKMPASARARALRMSKNTAWEETKC